MVHGLWFMVQGAGLMVQGKECRVQEVQGAELKVV